MTDTKPKIYKLYKTPTYLGILYSGYQKQNIKGKSWGQREEGKRHIAARGIKISITADFSTETMKARGNEMTTEFDIQGRYLSKMQEKYFFNQIKTERLHCQKIVTTINVKGSSWGRKTMIVDSNLDLLSKE